MGNYHTPGIIKFWWRNEFVETKYKSIHQIPVLTIDKQEYLIPETNSIIGIIHYDDSNQYFQIY